MLRGAVIAAAGAFAVFATALASPVAMADAPKCLNKANPYVACTDSLKTPTGQKANQTIRTTPLWGLRARGRLPH